MRRAIKTIKLNCLFVMTTQGDVYLQNASSWMAYRYEIMSSGIRVLSQWLLCKENVSSFKVMQASVGNQCKFKANLQDLAVVTMWSVKFN